MKNYPIFNHWYKTLIWLMERAEGMPRHARFTLSNRLIQHSLDILELIIQAIYQKERSPLLQQVNLKLETLRILVRICHDRRYLSTQQYRYAAEQLDATGRMVGGWLKQQ